MNFDHSVLLEFKKYSTMTTQQIKTKLSEISRYEYESWLNNKMYFSRLRDLHIWRLRQFMEKMKIEGEKDKIKGCLFNPLTITIDIISLAGLIAFYIIIYENIDKVKFSVEIIVLFSISLMHLVISFDLWRLNINLLANLPRLKSSK